MTVLEIGSQATIPIVESYLEQLNAATFSELRLPKKPIKSAALGGDAALIQCILTWARTNPNGSVITPLELGNGDDEARSLKHLASRSYSFIAMLAASDVLAADQSTSIRTRTNRACSGRVDAMAEGLQGAAFGHRTFLSCVDHSTKGNIPAFYFSDGTLRNRNEFADLAEELLLSRAAGFTKRNIATRTREGLGLILYELFKNTHDWGRTDLSHAPLRPSLRGMLFTRLNMLTSGATSSAGGNSRLESFVKHMGEKSHDEYVRFLEFSIFDSGPGLAARWLSQPIDSNVSMRQELEACFECLSKHKTTSGASTRGLGLFDVMKTLNELDAYVRLRTGRLSLCRSFVDAPLDAEEQIKGPELYDWKTESTEPTLMPKTEGTLFSIIIPLVEEGE